MLTESYKNRIQELAGMISEQQEFSFDWNYIKSFLDRVKNGNFKSSYIYQIS